MTKMDLSIIIVSFNTQDLTIDCIRSVIKTVKRSSYEIIVVDNNSRDNSVRELKLKIKDERLNIIKNRQNFGFSKANNIGLKRSSGRYVLFLNSDTVVYDRTIDEMVQFMEKNPETGAATCFIRMPNGKLDDAAHRGFPTPWRALSHFSGLSKIFGGKIFGGYNLKHLDFDKIHEVEALAGAFMLVRRNAGEEVGWWDEDFFWYGEDLDFCYRLKQKGWKIFFVPEYEILHYKGASGGIKNQSKNSIPVPKETKMRAHKARFEAMKIFYDKHYRKKYPGIVRSLVLGGINLKKFLSKPKI